jgi:hypothetical protein
VLALGSCISFAAVDQPAPPPGPPDCTDSYAPPIADTVISLAAFGVAVMSLAAHRDPHAWFRPGAGFIAGAFGYFALTAASAIYGFHGVGRCQDAYGSR